eukprot:gene14570-biopygen18643
MEELQRRRRRPRVRLSKTKGNRWRRALKCRCSRNPGLPPLPCRAWWRGAVPQPLRGSPAAASQGCEKIRVFPLASRKKTRLEKTCRGRI